VKWPINQWQLWPAAIGNGEEIISGVKPAMKTKGCITSQRKIISAGGAIYQRRKWR